MSWYKARFNKTICDDTGHEHVACQGEFFIQGDTAGEACSRAELAFRKTKRSKPWMLFADTIELTLASGCEDCSLAANQLRRVP